MYNDGLQKKFLLRNKLVQIPMLSVNRIYYFNDSYKQLQIRQINSTTKSRKYHTQTINSKLLYERERLF